ncbi:MAG: hypothetical protein CMO04_16260 [Thalassospira sp.]|nr:hypothetical protein [Thalassospira sp.]
MRLTIAAIVFHFRLILIAAGRAFDPVAFLGIVMFATVVAIPCSRLVGAVARLASEPFAMTPWNLGDL